MSAATEYDAIVIGGGHNGLVNAAYLAKSGLRTLILERRHTVGGAVGLAMVSAGGDEVTAAWLAGGSWTAEINGADYPVAVSLKPLYDPTNARIRA